MDKAINFLYKVFLVIGIILIIAGALVATILPGTLATYIGKNTHCK